jgi:hypothetical protein
MALAWLAAATAALGAADARAGVTETWSIMLPGQEFFDGGFLFVTGIGPPSGSTIVNTTFDINYVSDGTTPASELAIHVTAPVDGVHVDTDVIGTDLGFTSGPGTFTGTFATTALNGVTWNTFLPTPVIDIEIGSTNFPPAIDGSGYFVDSFIIFDYVPVPEPGSFVLLAVGAAGALVRRARTR